MASLTYCTHLTPAKWYHTKESMNNSIIVSSQRIEFIYFPIISEHTYILYTLHEGKDVTV